MATKEFNQKQKEIVARKLGYEGPMQGFDEFVNSDPALQRKYGLVLDKFMAKGGAVMQAKSGGVVKKFQEGGATSTITATGSPTKPTADKITANQITEKPGELVTAAGAPSKAATVGTAASAPPSVTAEDVLKMAVGQSPVNLAYDYNGDGKITSSDALAHQKIIAATPTTFAGGAAPTATTVTEETKIPAQTVTTETVAEGVKQAVSDLTAAQGTVSDKSQVTAQTMNPTDTQVGSVQAAQGVAREVEQIEPRKIEAGELVSGPAVNQAQVDAALAKNEAAQGIVSEDMTIQGQLAKLTANFEASNPPSWAAGSLRAATAALAQRGLGASSLAGQAVIQATLEAAMPIAAQDAQVFKDMGLQNLSNKQQMAVLTAQQRAQFLGQEFDQAFQTRVLNANKISEIANINFNARQQVALENARLAQTMDLANLNNRQAIVLTEAAQIATLEQANLNNRQQAAVQNAQAFLQMDLANLEARQQTAIFKTQSIVNSLLTDAAAENASRQFNATSTNQTNQFFASLSSQVKQFNAQQTNAMAQFNTEQANTVASFNAAQQNARDQFNAENSRIINQSNAEWRRNIALANTAATNRANELNASNALQITVAEYNNLWQKYRDDIEYSWKSGENVLDRENELAKQVLAKQAEIDAAKVQIEVEKYKAMGALTTKVLEKAGAIDVAGKLGADAIATIKNFAKATGTLLNRADVLDPSFTGNKVDTSWVLPTDPGYGWSYYDSGVAISPSGDYYYNGDLVWSPSTD